MRNAVAIGSGRSNGRPCNGNLATSTWERSLKTASGQVTAQCLWNACKALMAGMALILTGAAMATVGYYADELSMERVELTDDNNNTTEPLARNQARHFHLSNLSYVGPVIMGFGGFVIVATCVMTFEARDSAAKVAPVRLLRQISEDARAILASNTNTQARTSTRSWQNSATRGSRCSTEQSDQHNIADEASRMSLSSRHVMTTTLTKFGREIQTSIDSTEMTASIVHQKMKMKRSPSAPGLLEEHIPRGAKTVGAHGALSEAGTSGILMTKVSPQVMRIQGYVLTRQARSMDAPRDHFPTTSKCFDDEIMKHCELDPNLLSPDAKEHEVKSSEDTPKDWEHMTMDLHLPDCSITLKVEDESKLGRRQDSKPMGTKRRPLMRQSPIDHTDLSEGQPKSDS